MAELKREGEYQKVEGKATSFERIGTTLAAVLGGLLGLISLRMPFYVNIFTGVAMFFIALSFIEPKREKLATKNPLSDILKTVKYALNHPRVLSIMMFSAVILATGVIGIWGYLLYMEQNKFNLSVFGLAFALFQLTTAFAASYSHRISGKIGNKASILLLFLIPVSFITIGLVNSKYIILLAFLNAFVWGMSTPLFLNMINKLIKSDVRATVLSVSSMIGRLGFIFIAIMYGLLTDHASISAAFIMLGTIYALVGLASLAMMSKNGLLGE